MTSIPALSAQGKGRVERLWRTLQDRLIKEMRLASITTLDEANAFLPSFLSGYNARFAQPAREADGAWRATPADFDLDYHFWTRTARLVKRDHTLQWQAQCLQIEPEQDMANLANKRILVHVTPEGSVALYAGARRLRYRILETNEKWLRPAEG